MASLVLPISNRDHVQGPDDAPATLVEYGDYQCPFCGRAFWVVKDVQSRLGDQMRLVYRHFPLSQAHPRAVRAAEAAEAAGAQGSFWGMHDLLFENQQALEDEDLLAYAQHLGLDVPRFVRDLETHAFAPRVREDFLSGVRSGVNGTPTFFVNGRRHDGAWDADSLTEALVIAARLRAA